MPIVAGRPAARSRASGLPLEVCVRRNNRHTLDPSSRSQPLGSESARRWYRDGRLRVLKALAEQTADLRWSPALLKALLEELHTDDAFHELVRDSKNGSRQRLSADAVPRAGRSPQLATGRSLAPDATARPACHDVVTPPLHRRTPRAGRVRRPTHPHPEHHVFKSRARLRSVKALRSASTPTGGAGGLDGAVGLARRGPLRDAPGFHSPMARRTRDRKEKNDA